MKNRAQIACPSCGSTEICCLGAISPSDTFAGRRLEVTLSGGGLYGCRNCSCYFRFPRISKPELDSLYRAGSQSQWRPPADEKREDWTTALAWINEAQHYEDILDVGCSEGGFLGTLPDKFRRFGIEMQESAAAEAMSRGVEMLEKDYEALAFIERKFDVVTSFDVIEHVDNPLHYLRLLAGATRVGGMVILATGNSRSLTWRLMGSRYWYCAISEHISFINPQWCKFAADKCGLSLAEIKAYSHFGNSERLHLYRLKELLVNLTYKFFPPVIHALRRRGYGGTDVNAFPDLIDYPPSWVTSRDHIIARFKKAG